MIALMKLLKYTIALSLAFLAINVAQAAKSPTEYTAPFRNIEIAKGEKIIVNYNFNLTTEYLHCTYDPAKKEEITSIEWKYKGATRKLGLPVVLLDQENGLKNSFYADPYGQLVISNDFGTVNTPTGSITVSCVIHEVQPADVRQ
jgi:hypothetical protein